MSGLPYKRHYGKMRKVRNNLVSGLSSPWEMAVTAAI